MVKMSHVSTRTADRDDSCEIERTQVGDHDDAMIIKEHKENNMLWIAR